MARLNKHTVYMAARREDIDIWLRLGNPFEARRFIHEFNWNCPPEWRPDKVVTDSGRVIFFEDMTDAEAVVAAMEILRSVQIPYEMSEKKIHEECGWVC